MRRHARLCLMFMSGRDVLHNLIKIQEALWALTGRNIVLRYRLETQAWSYHVGCTCMGKLQLHQKKTDILRLLDDIVTVCKRTVRAVISLSQQ